MKTETLYINKNAEGKIQHLTEILPSIPSNVILHKTITGIGATYNELKANRNSIIVEPNIPVIVGKCNDPKHKKDNLLGVKEGVYTDDIVSYLEKSLKDNKKIKILTTPESFQKVKDAFGEIDLDMYSNCFLLFDECHKLVKDADYREDITLPVNDFFRFEEKALVSATPLSFSDKRFEKQDFKVLKIVPQFEYKIPLNLIYTNNVLAELNWKLGKLEGTICFFVNSTDMIYSLMKQLKIENESAVFCSQKSVKKLKFNNFKHVFDQWKEMEMRRYNFFTSRFYNAVDIEMKTKPTVILLSEVYFSEYTMFDPHTDVIQAIGRFRNGTKENYHIYNTNSDFPVRTEEEIRRYIFAEEEVYNKIKLFHEQATSPEFKNAYKAALDVIPFNQMLDKDGNKNFFTTDNYKDEALLKSAYNSQIGVIKYYQSNQLFNLLTDEEMFPLGDCERLKRQSKSISLKEKRKEIVRQLELLGDEETSILLDYKNELRQADSFICEAYEILGKEMIEQLNYSTKKIREAMIMKKFSKKITGTEFIQLLKNSFKVGKKYTLKFIKEELIRIYDLTKVQPTKKISGQTIRDFFEVKETQINRQKGFLIVGEKI